MTSEGLGAMFEGDSADMSDKKFPLESMRGRAEVLALADPGARTPIGAGRIYRVIEVSGIFEEKNQDLLLTSTCDADKLWEMFYDKKITEHNTRLPCMFY